MRAPRKDQRTVAASRLAIGDEDARALLDLQRSVAGCLDLDALLRALQRGLAPLLPVRDRVSLAFLEPDGEWMRIYRVLPPSDARPDRLPRVRVAGTVVGQVARDGVGRVVEDVRADQALRFGHASHDAIRSTASVPVVVAGRVVGAMNVGSRAVGSCDARMLDALADVASVVGPALYAAERVWQLVDERDRTERARQALEEQLAHEQPPAVVGRSAAFRSLLALARRAAQSDATVLLTGETGVGKTALARVIHGWSDRASGPFVPVHVADLQPSLVESELFGHERGAFTGAAVRRPGRFELADGGTLFLDEIGETPPALQAKLLRVLQDGCFERVGGERTLEVDVRVIAATNRDLEAAVGRGEFREDLFYRLNVVPLHLPPLRERPEDLEPLVGTVLARLASEGSGVARRIAPEAWGRLRAYDWPGNVRELDSVIRRAAVLEDGEELRLDGFPGPARRSEGPAPAAPAATEDWPTRDENERRYLRRVLEHTGGVIEGPRGAAALLGMQPSTLRSRLKRLGIAAATARRTGGR